ncbi:MAG: PmoA family protein [Gemmataceae bacterium]|nr:PmoA family protein [Gemmataceae bacterium]
MRALTIALVLLAASPSDAAEISVRMEGRRAEFFLDGELVTAYHFEPDLAKPYFWPILAPGQVRVTRGYPIDENLPNATKDHRHHRSAWFCHGDVIPEGVSLVPSSDRHVKGADFWSEAKGHGRIVCTEARTTSANTLVTQNIWQDSAGTKILDEVRTISLHAVRDGRLIVVEIELEATVAPLTFGDTKEGSFAVRVHDDLALNRKKPKSRLVNSAGASGEAAIWGHLADWCDYSGEVDGRHVGIAVFDAPSNPHRAAWHARGYGLLAANPFGRSVAGFPARKGQTDLVKLPRGAKLKLRYGIFLHSGDEKAGRVAEAFKEFARLSGAEGNRK